MPNGESSTSLSSVMCVALLRPLTCLSLQPHYERGHQFTVQHYVATTRCNSCGGFLWGVGNQGYQCSSEYNDTSATLHTVFVQRCCLFFPEISRIPEKFPASFPNSSLHPSGPRMYSSQQFRNLCFRRTQATCLFVKGLSSCSCQLAGGASAFPWEDAGAPSRACFGSALLRMQVQK